MRNLAIITARSGSKGIEDKNIKELNGKPLLAYSIEAARNTSLFAEIMVSTDSEKYASISRELGANVPFLQRLQHLLLYQSFLLLTTRTFLPNGNYFVSNTQL